MGITNRGDRPGEWVARSTVGHIHIVTESLKAAVEQMWEKSPQNARQMNPGPTTLN